MIFRETRLRGAFVIEPERLTDARGFFARTWCAREFADRGLNPRLVQVSISYSASRGTTRGLHYQEPPHQEAKLVRCTRGSMYDVLVDLRSDSETYASWVAVTLTADNRRAVYIPEGFAHGFQTFDDDTEVVYQMSEFHTPQAARGARFDDPAFSIDWPPVAHRVMSAQDLAWPAFRPVQTRKTHASI